MAGKRFLFVLTSHGRLGDSNEKTGFHYSEMTDPYYVLQDAGIEVDIASIKGGNPPHDPGSLKADPAENPDSVNRFRSDPAAMAKLENTLRVGDADISRYEGVYMPGGHGTMWDFPDSGELIRLIEDAWAQGKIVAAVCHGPAALIAARNEDGVPLVQDRRVSSFTDIEEQKAGKDGVVPFLLESKLRDLGAIFEAAPPFQEISVVDGPLVTGQNPASAAAVAHAILDRLGAPGQIGHRTQSDSPLASRPHMR